jgi:hypothetical protein
MNKEALEDRLKSLDEEIVRLTMLASQSSVQHDQDNYLLLAQDLQRETRILRSAIGKLSESDRASQPGATADDASSSNSAIR